MPNKVIKLLSIAFILFYATSCTSSKIVTEKYINLNYDSQNTTLKKINNSILDGIKKEQFIVIFNSSEDYSIELKDNTVKVLEYMKKQSDVLDISKSSDIDYSKYDYIIIETENLESIPRNVDLFSQIQKGAGVFFATRLDPRGQVFESIKAQIGILSVGDILRSVKGIRVESDILIKAKGFSSLNPLFNQTMNNFKLDKDCTIHLNSYDGTPLLWSKEFGMGKIVAYNGSPLKSKINRGLLAGAISLLRDGFVYPVVNAKIFDIDDFPAPISNGTYSSIDNMNIGKFYDTVWLPQMIDWSKRFNIIYNIFFIQNYNDRVDPPFEKDNTLLKKPFLAHATKILDTSGEVGLHGYNHQPLAFKGSEKYDLGYIPWKSEESMIQATQSALTFFHRLFPNYTITSYVPPSNIISNEGRKALISAVPTLKVISGIYIDKYYGQEFDIGLDGVVNFPRATAGYIIDDEAMWTMYNTINLYGIFSHFVHSDDFFDFERSKGSKWSELKIGFEEFLQKVSKDYYWIRPMTNTSASAELKKYVNLEPYVEYNDNQVIVYNNNFSDSAYYIIRTKHKVNGEGCSITQIDENAYLIQGLKPIFKINMF